MKRLTIALLVCAGTGSAAPATTGPTVPAGLVADVWLQVPGPLSLRRLGGELHVGGWNGIWTANGQVVQGDYFAAAFDRTPDGTLYVGDALTFGNLRKYSPGSTTAVVAVSGFKYCHGVAVLPSGEVLAVDVGWIAFSGDDGRVVRLTGSTWIETLPEAVDASLFNPASIRVGPDGYVYLVERGFIQQADGKVYRFVPGGTAELVVDGLVDPWDVSWGPDGAMFVTDGPKILRWTASGGLQVWASGFVEVYGIDVAPNGNVYVADLGAGVVYRIHPASVAVAMSWHPQTLNLGSNGNYVKAEIAATVASAHVVAVDGAPVAPIPAVTLSPVKFERSAVQAVLTPGDRLLRVEGTSTDGTPFHAEAWIHAIQN